MSKSQTVISIRRDKVKELRKMSVKNPTFLKNFLDFHSVSNHPAYISDAIFVSHSEQESVNTCHIITPFLGATLNNIFHKSFEKKDNGIIQFYEKNKIIENLVMGYKGIFEVSNLSDLEIQSDYANAKNSFYSVFGIKDSSFDILCDYDFNKMLDITDFDEKDKEDSRDTNFLNGNITNLGSFAQRQVCLAFQSNGIFKSYPFKSNKSIHLDVDGIIEKMNKEAYKLNDRLSFASEKKKEQLLMQYVSSYKLRESLSEDLFEAFILGLKGKVFKIESEKTKEKEDPIEEDDEDDDFDDEPKF